MHPYHALIPGGLYIPGGATLSLVVCIYTLRCIIVPGGLYIYLEVHPCPWWFVHIPWGASLSLVVCIYTLRCTLVADGLYIYPEVGQGLSILYPRWIQGGRAEIHPNKNDSLVLPTVITKITRIVHFESLLLRIDFFKTTLKTERKTQQSSSKKSLKKDFKWILKCLLSVQLSYLASLSL